MDFHFNNFQMLRQDAKIRLSASSLNLFLFRAPPQFLPLERKAEIHMRSTSNGPRQLEEWEDEEGPAGIFDVNKKRRCVYEPLKLSE